MMRDRAILPPERSRAVALMNHHEILNIAAGADPISFSSDRVTA